FDADLRPVELAQHLRDRNRSIARGAAELTPIACRRVLILEKLVQPRRVRRVDADLERLQPVAIPVALERERVLRRRDERVEMRERRRLALAEIGEEDAALLDDRIGAQTDVLAQAATFRLGGCLHTA